MGLFGGPVGERGMSTLLRDVCTSVAWETCMFGGFIDLSVAPKPGYVFHSITCVFRSLRFLSRDPFEEGTWLPYACSHLVLGHDDSS